MVGCGHGFESIIVALLADRPISITAIDRVGFAVDSSQLLLRRVVMALWGCTNDEASRLDLTRPVQLGSAEIHFQLCDAWTITPSSAYDLIYSAAEQDAGLVLYLQALAGCCLALLCIYSRMWANAMHRAPPTGSPVPVSLEVSGERRDLVTRDLRAYPMFVQPPSLTSRRTIQAASWSPFDFTTSRVRLGCRIAIYDERDDLWAPASLLRTSRGKVTLQFDDPSWSNYEALACDVDCPPMLVFEPSVGSSGRLVGSSSNAARSSAGPSGLPSSSTPSSLSRTASTYRGVSRNGLKSWRARIWRDGSLNDLGSFSSPEAASRSYEAERLLMPEPSAPSHCIVWIRPGFYSDGHRRSGNYWQVRLYAHGRYTHILGRFASRPDAVDAYFVALHESQASLPTPALAPPVQSWFGGVALKLSSASSTGYKGVQPHGNRFRAVIQSRIDGRKRCVTLGVFDTAVEAAYHRAVSQQ